MLPVIKVDCESCGEGWEMALKEVWENGIYASQHYHDKVSKEASLILNIKNPLGEPRFSRKDFVSVGMFLMGEEKRKSYREKQYVKDFLDGDMDIKVSDGIESYTYHSRLWKWGLLHPKHEKLLDKKGFKMQIRNSRISYPTFSFVSETINQIEMLIRKAKEESISRKLQVTTWQPHKDLLISGSPCLQRIWIRLLNDKMVMETSWRSRDLYKAFGANLLALTEFGKYLAKELNVEFIQMVDFSNSLHIYQSDFEQVKRHFEIIENRKQ